MSHFAGKRGTKFSLPPTHDLGSALSAYCLDTRVALLDGDGLFRHRLPDQSLIFLTIPLLRHFRHLISALQSPQIAA
jgi:hypothetical protein